MQEHLTRDNAIRYLKKLELLEKKIGHITKYKCLLPETLKNNHGFQDDAKSMLKYLNLDEKPVTISIGSNREGIGGNIEEDSDMVFIEISPDISKEKMPSDAVIAHELMHHYLRSKSIYETSTIENEILTDIATIYTGLGIFTLEGVAYKYLEIENNTRMAMHKYQIGYIDFDSFCFVYYIINKFRRISDHELLNGLTKSTAKHLKELMKTPIFIDYGNAIEFANEKHLLTKITELSVKTDQTEKELLDIQDKLLNYINTNQNIKSIIHSFEEKTLQNISDAGYNTVLKNMSLILCDKEFETNKSEIAKLNNQVCSFVRIFSQAESHTNSIISKKFQTIRDIMGL